MRLFRHPRVLPWRTLSEGTAPLRLARESEPGTGEGLAVGETDRETATPSAYEPVPGHAAMRRGPT